MPKSFLICISLLFISEAGTTQLFQRRQRNVKAGNAVSQLMTTIESSQCIDRFSFCADYDEFCSDPVYLSFLCNDCPATCGFCDDIGQAICKQAEQGSTIGITPQTGTPKTVTLHSCYDKSIDCSYYTSFCNKLEYRQQMCTYCQKTCGLCSDSSCSNNNFKKIFKNI